MASLKIKVDADELGKVINEYMDDLVDFIFQNSQENIVDKNIIDEGTLLKSGNVQRKFLEKSIVYPVPWADSTEFGRLPGSHPPVDPIKEWVKRKLGVKDEKQASKIAWAIAKDIEKNGLMPRPYLQPAIEAGINRFVQK